VCPIASKAIRGGFDPRQALAMSMYLQSPTRSTMPRHELVWTFVCSKADEQGNFIPIREPG
jgi:hypothetical protein